jgi:uncharacterized protein (DUF427 family)
METKNMTEKQIKLPGPDHPISIERNPARVVVSVAGRVVAYSRNALTLREATYFPVQYFPPEDVDFSQLVPQDRVTYCPYKGGCKLSSTRVFGKLAQASFICQTATTWLFRNAASTRHYGASKQSV